MHSNLTLESPISQLKGVGPNQEKKLLKLGISTVKDLLFHIPFRYRDTSELLSISDFKTVQEGTFLGQIVEAKNVYTKSRKVLTRVKIIDNKDKLDLTYFNQSYLTKTLKVGEWYIFDGKITEKARSRSVINPKYEKYAGDIKEQKHLGKIIGIYHETEGINSRWIRQVLLSIKPNIKQIIDDPLSKEVLKKENLLPLYKALRNIHFPSTREDIVQARDRLAFDEILRIAIDIEKDIEVRSKLNSLPVPQDRELTKEFLKSLPYTLTKDQQSAVKEILQDISKAKPMNRLLNGDVGSGKTVVAALAVIQAIRNNFSAVVLAPTTVLAQQHFETFSKLLKPFDIDIELWISSKKTKGQSPNRLIIGTHAVLYKKDIPENLNLVIVDEQHRFGVEQREQLLTSNSTTPHYLTMTATPIPRSLTEIVFGNVDVTVILEKPKSRKEIETHFVPYFKRHDCFKWIAERIKKSKYKEQSFIVYPLIEESQNFDAKAVKTEFENLSSNEFSGIKTALLHGRLKEKEKNEILEDFREKKFNVLVTTSVIEVGIDIPDATVMVIEDAQRFGLAQLHQLRGRVGRSDKQSYCYVIAGESDEDKEESIERLKYFAKHPSGFDVAEYDLNRRGPGEVYGLRQSGVPVFKIASITDLPLLKKARGVAKDIVKMDNTQLENIKERLFK